MSPTVLETNTFTYAHAKTGVTGLESLMDCIVLVLLGNLFALPYRQAAHTGRGKFTK